MKALQTYQETTGFKCDFIAFVKLGVYFFFSHSGQKKNLFTPNKKMTAEELYLSDHIQGRV